jgi:hypothetical protein
LGHPVQFVLVIPAQAGINRAAGRAADEWIPTVVGMTIKE